MAPVFEDEVNIYENYLNPNIEEELDKIMLILRKFPSKRTDAELKSIYLLLQEIEFFNNFWKEMSSDFCIALLKSLKYEHINKGQILFNYGDPQKFCYVLLKGSVSILEPQAPDRITSLDFIHNFEPEFNHEFRQTKNFSPTLSASQILKNDSPRKLDIGSSSKNFGNKEQHSPNQSPSPTTLSPSKKKESPRKKLDFKGYSFSLMTAGGPLTVDDLCCLFPDYKLINTIEKGCFGEPSNEPNAKRMFTAVARETCQFLVLDLRSYKQIKAEYEEKLHKDALEFLKSIPLTKEWSNSRLISLLKHCKSLHLIRNSIIYNIGDPTNCIYFIKNGEVEIVKEILKDSYDDDLLQKEKKVKKSTISAQKVNLLGMNMTWKKKYTKINTQEIKIALIGARQSFGEEEFINKKENRQFRAVVKSSSAEILCAPISKLIEHAKHPEKFFSRLANNDTKAKWRENFETEVLETNQYTTEEEITRTRESTRTSYIPISGMMGLRVIDIQARKYFQTNQNQEEIKSGTLNKLFFKYAEKKSRHNDQKSFTNSKVNISSQSPLRSITHNTVTFTEGSLKTKSSPISALLNDVFHSSPTEGETPTLPGVKTLPNSKQASPGPSPESSFRLYNPKSLQRIKSPSIQIKPQGNNRSCIQLEKNQLVEKSLDRKSPAQTKGSIFLASTNYWQSESYQNKGQSSKMISFKKALHDRLGINRIFPEETNLEGRKQISPQFFIKGHKNNSLSDWKHLSPGGNKANQFDFLSDPKIKVNNASPKLVMKLKKRVKSLHSSVLLSKAIIAPKISEASRANKLFTSQSPQRQRTVTISSILEKKSTNFPSESHRQSNMG